MDPALLEAADPLKYAPDVYLGPDSRPRYPTSCCATQLALPRTVDRALGRPPDTVSKQWTAHVSR